jgi:hypothetical protein
MREMATTIRNEGSTNAPNYLRVKIWRRLQRLGAVAIKNSVYVLPRSEQGQEDFQWVLREISEGGGDASICEARFVDGLSDEQVEALFQIARDADYAQITEDARRLAETVPTAPVTDGEHRTQLEADFTRLKRRLAEVVAIDFFGASGREAAEGLLSGVETRMHGNQAVMRRRHSPRVQREHLEGKTWVTRKGIHVDRMACAWLISLSLIRQLALSLFPAKGYKPLAEEVRFDMFEAEFTHERDRCSMEVLIERVGLDDAALSPIAEIVHDIDLKDSKFERQETIGIERLIAGIAMANKNDQSRLARGIAVFDDLYQYFKKKRS